MAPALTKENEQKLKRRENVDKNKYKIQQTKTNVRLRGPATHSCAQLPQ